tara:strand:- start:383 stop:613 length:231 start_codon:yes stop_codon:yes gene_type:complete
MDDQKKQLRDYEELLDFAKEEVAADKKRVVAIRATDPDSPEIEEINKEIELLNKGIDRYQKNIKILTKAIHESQNS